MGPILTHMLLYFNCRPLHMPVCRSLQHLLQLLNNRPQRLQSCIFFIHRNQNMPGGVSRTRLLQHLIDRLLIDIPFLPVPPVLICDFPLFFRRILPHGKAFKLRVFINVNPEFDDDRSPVKEVLFKFVDLIIGTLPVIFTAEAFQTLYITRPYQVRSKTAMCPVLGSLV